MAEGWKQVWEDLRNALRGVPPEAPVSDEPSAGIEPTASQPALAEGASLEAARPETAAPAPDQPTAPAAEGAPVEITPMPAEGARAAGPPGASDTAASAPDTGAGAAELTSAAAAATPAEDAAPPGAQPAAEAAPEEAAAQPAPRWRRFTWILVALLVGVVLVNSFFRFGGASLWEQWTAPRPPAPDVLATFDGDKITIADLEAHLKVLVPEEYRDAVRSPEALRLVVQEMVTDELARRWATTQKKDDDQTFQHTMEHITEDINLDSFNAQLHASGIPVPESEIQAYYEANKARFGDQTLSAAREQIRQTLASQKEGQYLKDYIAQLKNNASITRDFTLLDVPAPTEADLRAHYEANTQSYTSTAQFTVDMLTVPAGGDESAARAAADKALLKLRAGDPFEGIPAQVPEVRVITNTVVLAGDFGAEWDAVVQKLQPGQLSDVFRDGRTFSVVRMIQSQPSRTLTFEEARSQVLAAARKQRLDAWMKDNGAKTLFILKSKPYTLGQFYNEYQELPPEVQAQFAGSKGMKDLADRLIDRLLLVEDTYDQLLQVKNKDLIDQTRLDVLKQMMDQQEVDDKIQVADDEILQFYDQNQALMTPPPRARIRYIRIGLGQTEDEQKKAHARADEAYTKLVPGLLQQGADFAAVAKEYSEDPETAANGGEFPGWLGETNNPLEPPELHELHQIILGLDANQIAPLFDLGDSIYIIQVIERQQPKTLSFDEAKPYIKEQLTQQKHDDLQQQLQDRLAKQANVIIYDSVLQAYAARLGASADNPAPASGPTPASNPTPASGL